ncbi:MAG: M48 family metalloprotease [Acidobacteria bacterium]|nr:M48 family metalloprotease [Acidobacteriota bacterium]MBV9478695.1 M48 family metalloprotease [Acidobacteriota bacterium]
MNAMELLTGPLAQAIGWALLHLLWQATIVAAILGAVLALLSNQSAGARYVASCAALAVVFTMFLGTAWRAYDPAVAPIAVAPHASAVQTSISLAKVPLVIAVDAARTWRERATDLAAAARQSLPGVVALWLVGVALLSLRLLVSWSRARNLVRRDATEASPQWLAVAARLSNALGLRRGVRLLESAAIEVPSVIGSLRPVILLPASTLTGLTPEQLEMVLAHELAHIRRHDFLVNLLQAFVETLMFYHPAVWWMSRRVRIEREHCCDDLAVSVCGNPLQYARALTRLEELRAAALPVVVAANGGSLLERIRRIATRRTELTASSPRWTAAVAMLVIVGAALAVPSLPALAQRDTSKTAKHADAKKSDAKKSSSRVEVVAPESNNEHEDDITIDNSMDDDADNDTNNDNDDDYAMPAIPPTPGMPAAPPVPMVAPSMPSAPAMPGTPALPAPPAIPAAPMIAGMPHPMVAPRAPVAMAALNDPDVDVDVDADVDVDTDSDERDPHDRKLSDGKLTVDELIAMRAVGVTPQYVNEMRALFPDVTVHELVGARAVGVSTEYVRKLRDAGIEVKSARAAQNLAAVGVKPEFIRAMRDTGLAVNNAHDAQGLAAVGVTAEFIRSMRDAGMSITTAREAQGLAAVGVTAQYIRDMRAAGVQIHDAREAQSLRSMGVTPKFVHQLADAGYANLTVRELVRMAANGVDGDFIREMEQYRSKQ